MATDIYMPTPPATPYSSIGRSLFANMPASRLTQKVHILEKVANVSFDTDGDVVLLLKNYKGTARFRVNSSILCMSSPVFRAMLGVNSHFKEGKELASRCPGMAPVEVKIEDDNPNVLAVILRILHHQHYLVPNVITGDTLYEVAILCDKYDLRQALSFWLDKWIPTPHELPSFVLPGSAASQDDKRLFMAYVFRKEEVFKAMSRNLILTYKDVGLFGDTPQFEDIPETIVDAIMEARTTAIEDIVSCVQEYITSYGNTTGVRCLYNREPCDAFALGLLIREFKRVGLYPESPSIHKQSVKGIRDKIMSLKQPEFVFFDKAVGCCLTPQLCECAAVGTCVYCLYRDRVCVNCKKYHKPMNETCTNHADCSPLESICTKVTEIVDRIEGLQYSHFVGIRNGEGGNGFNADDLWDCLKYI